MSPSVSGYASFLYTWMRWHPKSGMYIRSPSTRTEAGPRSHPFGEFGFAELLGTLAGESPQAVVDAVEAAVFDAHEGEPRDDIALLALGLAPR